MLQCSPAYFIGGLGQAVHRADNEKISLAFTLRNISKNTPAEEDINTRDTCLARAICNSVAPKQSAPSGYDFNFQPKPLALT